MRLHDVFSSPSFTDILYSLDEGDTSMGKHLSAMTQARQARKAAKKEETARTKHAKLRASQGAALSGHHNVPDGVGHVPAEESTDPMQRAQGIEDGDIKNNEQKHVDFAADDEVGSSQPDERLHGVIIPRKDIHMTLTLKGLNKKGTQAFYVGARAVIRISTANFVDKQPPAELLIDDVLVGPKVKLTKEERAALRASQPKPTAAEIVARAEARLAKLKAKLTADM